MKKIMFNDKYGLTEAVLSGRKTQTRRIIKPQPTFNENHGIVWRGFAYGLSLQLDEIKGSCKNFITGTEYDKSCKRYRVGEVIAVAQSYKDAGYDYCMSQAAYLNKMYTKAEYMPHQIRITNVRVERLQDISDADCIAEGVELNDRQFEHDGQKFYCVRGLGHWRGIGCDNFNTPREVYAALIDRISGKGTWDSNPYVFVYNFELIKS